jgi:hypothetical protein
VKKMLIKACCFNEKHEIKGNSNVTNLSPLTGRNEVLVGLQ